MAGAGRGRPRKAGAARPDQRKPSKVLEDRSDAEVPPMPDASEWIPLPQGPAEETEPNFEPQWSQAVVDWWESIWTSPMSSEFVDADIHGLYMACVYMHESLNPYYKVTDRLKMGQAWEKAIQSYGLTPTARESLRWAISQGTQAENRTNQIRAQQKAESRAEAQKKAVEAGVDNVTLLYKNFS